MIADFARFIGFSELVMIMLLGDKGFYEFLFYVECFGCICHDPDPADGGNVQQSWSYETALPEDTG